MLTPHLLFNDGRVPCHLPGLQARLARPLSSERIGEVPLWELPLFRGYPQGRLCSIIHWRLLCWEVRQADRNTDGSYPLLLEDWDKRRAYGMLIIRTLCDAERKEMINDIDHPHLALQFFRTHYASKLKANIFRLKTELFKFTMDQQKSVVENITKLKAMARADPYRKVLSRTLGP